MVLLMAAPVVRADWQPFFQGDVDTIYIDHSSLKREGPLRRMWMLVDFKSMRRGALSTNGLWEFDCASKQSRVRTMSLYAGHMGRGEVIFFAPDDPRASWQFPPPGTANGAALSFACDQ
jgi:hypothetical protein